MSLYKYDGQIQVHVEKIIRDGKAEYKIWTNYGDGAGSFSMDELKTEEDVAASIRKSLENDKRRFNIPSIKYNLDVSIFHVKLIKDTPEEESQTKRNIEALLENTTDKEISFS